jgi:glutamate 5-kinase
VTTDKAILIKRLVVKIGTSTLTDATGGLDREFLADLAQQVARLRTLGIEVVIVTSGAIGVGLRKLGYDARARPDDLPTLQAAAALGQLELAQAYVEAFAPFDAAVAQILLTRADTANRESYLHARETLLRLLELGAIPLVNENDTVAVDEIRFGDNDTLATLVATLIDTDLVVLLSDIEGLYTADPRRDEDAHLLQEIGTFTEDLRTIAGDAGTVRGSGGMLTKIEAARVLMAAGIPLVICEGHKPNALYEAACGRQVGTRFKNEEARRQQARKLWIALAAAPSGSVVIDDGAVVALRERGSSLLPVGIVEVEGAFESGVPIDVFDQAHALVGRGITRYSRDEIAVSKGHRMEHIARNKLLAHLAGRDVIHRDEMIVF